MLKAIKYSEVVEEQNCSTLDEFLPRIRRSHAQWWDGEHCLWSFRGHWDARWKLLPTAFRRDPAPKGFLNILREARFRYPCDKMPDGLERDQIAQFCAEAELLSQFSTLARNVGLQIVQMPMSPFLHFGWQDEWRRKPHSSGESMLEDGNCPDLRIAAIAQHHGIPTRLLDFTGNPMLAAFFAATPELRPENHSTEQICIWAFRNNPTFRFLLRDIAVINAGDGHIMDDEYIRAQDGRFLLIKRAGQWYMQHGQWPSVEDVVQSAIEQEGLTNSEDTQRFVRTGLPLFRKISLPNKLVPDLLKLLDREEISVPHLMPTFDNVSRTLTLKWSQLN